jgi:hypothetical protein
MKRTVLLSRFSLSLALAIPSWLVAQDVQPTQQPPSAQADQPVSQPASSSSGQVDHPSPLVTSDQTVQPSPSTPTDTAASTAQPIESETSSSAYQPPTPDSTSPPPPPPSKRSDRFEKNHGEVEAFADYLRFTPAATTTNYVGLGGLVGFNVHPNLALEAQMSYDFARNFTTSTTNGVTTTFVTTRVRPLTGLFGPKLQFGTSSPFRAFLTGKVGFIDFSTSTSGAVSGGTVGGAIEGVGGNGTHFAVYPGGGIEMFAGWLGLRLEAGDEIYLNNGTYNNLHVAVGPVIRF